MRTEGKVRLIVLNALAQPECVARREEQARAACAPARSIPMLSCALGPTLRGREGGREGGGEWKGGVVLALPLQGSCYRSM